MMQRAGKQKRQQRMGQIALLCLAIAVTLVLSVQLWTLSARKIEDLRSSRIDSVVWTLGQLEVEYLQLELSLKNLQMGGVDPAAADQVRRRFDVYYNRTETLRVSPVYRSVLQDAESQAIIQTLTMQNSRLAPRIDAPDRDLVADAPALLADLRGTAMAIRQVATHGNAVGAAQGEKAREEVGEIMLRLSIVTAVLMVLLAALAGLFFRLSQQNARRARDHMATSVRLAEVLGTSPDALIVTDGQGRVVEFNQAAADLLKIDRETALGRSFDGYLRDQGGAEIPLPFVETGRVSGQELDLRAADGSHVPVEVSQGVAEVESDRFHVYFLRDITERQQAQRALTLSRDKALAGERAKSRFLAVMSHEMRTPLNGILGIVELMRDRRRREAKIDHYLDLLQHSGQTLLNNVNDVLDIAQLEAEGITLSETPFDFDAMLERLIAPMRVEAERRGNRLHLETHPRRLGGFIGDEQRLYQVISNLVGNAIKFTENGEVGVVVSTQPITGEDRVRLEVQVHDTGIGIAEEEKKRIFEDFVRLEHGDSPRREGTGLGLGIARRIVNAMGGEIGVDSIPSDGSLFWFHVDLTPVADQDLARPGRDETPGAEVRGLSVLVVEDIPTNRFVLREMLGRAGCKVTEAVNGREGADMARATRFDLILMDVNMPVMGGIEAARLIRKEGASRDSRIVAVTAHAVDQDSALFREAGMDAVMSKPISLNGIRAILNGEGLTEKPRDDAALLDEAHLAQLLRNLSPERADRLIAGLGEETPALLRDLDSAAWDAPGDIAERVHALSGVAAMVGAQRLHNVLSRLEDSLNGDDPQDLQGWASLLAALWADTQGALEDFLSGRGRSGAQDDPSTAP